MQSHDLEAAVSPLKVKGTKISLNRILRSPNGTYLYLLCTRNIFVITNSTLIIGMSNYPKLHCQINVTISGAIQTTPAVKS